MKILITGVAGFIGFSLASKLLEINKYNIYGIDNFDDYYSVKLKRERIKILHKKKKFIFKKIDITSDQISSYLKNKKLFLKKLILHLIKFLVILKIKNLI